MTIVFRVLVMVVSSLDRLSAPPFSHAPPHRSTPAGAWLGALEGGARRVAPSPGSPPRRVWRAAADLLKVKAVDRVNVLLEMTRKEAMGGPMNDQRVLWFEDLDAGDVARVGGKNASLGEMIRALSGEGIRVPAGFATTADAYRELVAQNDLGARVQAELAAWRSGGKSLEHAGQTIRRLFLKARLPEPLTTAILGAYRELSRRYGVEEVDVAVRSSATAEDLPDASFAGQQETYLNIQRRRGAARRLPALLRLALHRPGDQLPRGQGLRPPRGRASRSASRAWCAPTWPRPASCSRSTPRPASATSC